MDDLLNVSTEPVIPAATAAPATEPSSWMPLTDEQRASAPESIRALLEAKKWASVEDGLKGYAELEKFVGVGKHIVIPTDDNPESWNDVWNQLGRPKDPAEYILEPNDAINDELASKWKQFAHQEGYTQKQMAGAVQFQLDIISGMNKAQNDEREATKVELTKKWGGEQAYKNNTIEARMIADRLGIYQKLEAKGLASDPDVIEMLIDIKNKTAEGVIAPATQPQATQDPITERAAIMKDPDWVDHLKHPTRHNELQKRYLELCAIITNTGLAPKRIQDG